VTPLYPQKLALTSPTGGGRSVGIVRSRTKATELYTYMLISCFHPENDDVRRDLVPQIVTYTYYIVSSQVLYNLTMAW